MKILDPNAKEIRACVQMHLLGAFYISLTTIPNVQEMRVFQERVSGAHDDVTHLFFPECCEGSGPIPSIANITKLYIQVNPHL